MGLQNIRQKSAAVAAITGLGAMLVGCSGSARPDTASSFGATGVPVASSVAPMAVSCEPNQRAVIRQVPVNGGIQAQVQCETIAGIGAVGTTGAYGAPVAYQPGVQPVNYAPAQAVPLEDTRFARVPAQPVVTRSVAPQPVSYQR